MPKQHTDALWTEEGDMVSPKVLTLLVDFGIVQGLYWDDNGILDRGIERLLSCFRLGIQFIQWLCFSPPDRCIRPLFLQTVLA